jgi:hypothetical protein
VPGLVVVVVEEDHVREVGIVINDVGEVHHRFVALVFGNGIFSGRIIGHIDLGFPIRMIGRGQPCQI